MRNLFCALFALILLASCDGPPPALRRGVAALATGVDAVDGPAAEAYTDAHVQALEASATLEAYVEAMRPWNVLEEGVRASATALLALDAALDAWTAGGNLQWLQLAACAVRSLRELVSAAEAVGFDELPADMISAIDLLATFAGGVCTGRP